MKPTIVPKRGTPLTALIQAAGVHDEAEAVAIVQSGIPCIGLPLRLPVHQEDLTENHAANVCRRLRELSAEDGGPACAVCITYLNDAATISSFVTQLGVSHIQLHGDISADELAKLRALMPSLYIIKSLVIRTGGFGTNGFGANDFDANILGADKFCDDNRQQLYQIITETASIVDAYITDTHDPQTGADGATGKVHDWAISKSLVQRSPLPVILAGGLTPENVRDAILQVKPAGVDAHTGLEGADGRKDNMLCRRFAHEALTAFALLDKA